VRAVNRPWRVPEPGSMRLHGFKFCRTGETNRDHDICARTNTAVPLFWSLPGLKAPRLSLCPGFCRSANYEQNFMAEGAVCSSSPRNVGA
ncbi:MAG: hypothetical protein WHV61_05555, partial [Burkholderiales bacterium]